MAGKATKAPADSLEATVALVQKQFGAESLVLLDHAATDVVGIPTGSTGLDQAIGVGGWPRGRVSEIFGPESCGKTTITLHAIGNVQRAGGTAAFIDAEHALDPSLVRACGGVPETLLFSQPDNGEQALGIVDYLVASGQVDIVVVDSVAALVPKVEIDGEVGDSHMALQARLMGQALRKITASLGNQSRCAVVFINQLRERPGVVFGNPEYQPGGKALKFYASLRLDVRATEKLRKSDKATDPYGNRLKVRVVKNKVARPFRQAEFDLWFGTGINRWGELLDLAVANGVVQKNGSFYGFGGSSLGQGHLAASGMLYQYPDLYQQIYQQVVPLLQQSSVLSTAGMSQGVPEAAAPEPEPELVIGPPAFMQPPAEGPPLPA